MGDTHKRMWEELLVFVENTPYRETKTMLEIWCEMKQIEDRVRKDEDHEQSQ